MSASLWDWSLASADGLLTTEECSLLLDADILNTDDDLLKTFPTAATKLEDGLEYACDDVSSSLYPPSPPETKPSRSELAHDLLLQLDNSCKQENIFSNWLEEKVELPIFEAISLAPAPAAVAVAPRTDDLLREFETVYGAVELTHLTPPQSPPLPATQLLQSYAHLAAAPAPLAPAPAPAPAAAWPQPDLERALQDVDELVRRRAEQLTDSGASSPRSSPPSSPRSTSDDEWAAPAHRAKPYARSDDRRSRKKEQNKNAATRYRQKKKAEVEVLLQEEAALRGRHAALGTKCSDLQREIRYLKGLMRDLFKAKGLIK